MRKLVLLLFFCSGATSLVYEVLWMRRLSLIFGHSIFSVSTVLTAFMAGLAIGSYGAGRWSDKKRSEGAQASNFLSMYGGMELFIGLWALLSIVLLGGVESGYFALARQGNEKLFLNAFIFAGSFLILLPPTIAMGATLPIFTQVLVMKRENTGEQLSKLYGFNTLGAFAGAIMGGVVLLPNLGLVKSVVITAFVNAAIAVLAYRVSKNLTEEPSDQSEAENEEVEGKAEVTALSGSLFIPAVFGISGFTGMVYQLGWTRALILSIGSSTYSFSLILAAFLSALGLGSLLYKNFFARRKPQVLDLARLQLGIAITAWLCTAALGYFPHLKLMVIEFAKKQSFVMSVALDFLAVFLLLLIPVLLLGLTFPLVTHLYTARLSNLGRSLGEAYSANTAGAIGGSFLSGFVLIPVLGAQNSLTLAVLLNTFGALLLIWQVRMKLRTNVLFESVLVLLVLVGCFVGPRWNSATMAAGVAIYGSLDSSSEPIFYRDGYTSTVTVGLNPGRPPTPFLRVNGKTDASLVADDRSTFVLLGLMSVALHPAPERVGVIGFGSGQTLLGPLLDPAVKDLWCAELEPAVMEARPFFEPYSLGLFDSPKLTIVEDDGRTFVMGSAKKFDVIVNQPSNPWIAGIGNLFTEQFYESCKEQLKDNGLVFQWLQLYSIGESDIQMVLRTFYRVFPHGIVLRTSKSDILLVGSLKPYEISRSRLDELWTDDGVAQLFYTMGLVEPELFFGTYLASREQVVEYLDSVPGGFETGPINTDDLPLLEFRAPLGLFYSQRIFDLDAVLSHLVPTRFRDDPEIVQGGLLGRLALKFKLNSADLGLFESQQQMAGDTPGYRWTERVVELFSSPFPSQPQVADALQAAPPWYTHYFLMLRKNHRLPGVYPALYQRALESPIPGCQPDLYFETAVDALKRQQIEEARNYFELAAEISTEDVALVLSAILEPNPADWNVEKLNRALTINPYNTDTRKYLAQHYLAKGDTAEALKQAEAGYELKQNDIELLPILIDLLGRDGQVERAARLDRKLVELRQRFGSQ